MKKTIFCVVLCFILLLMTGCFNKTIMDGNYTIIVSEKVDCKNVANDYFTKDGHVVYLVCLDEVKLKDDKQEIALKDYLQQQDKTIDESLKKLLSKLTVDDSLWDGGTTIYRDGGTKMISVSGITIIKCNTLEGNKDIYIGNGKMNVDEGFKKGFCGKKVNPTIEDQLNEINDKITKYFSFKNYEYKNLSAHYVDNINDVVVVELLDNSEEQQESFKRLVCNSPLIKFIQGGPYTVS